MRAAPLPPDEDARLKALAATEVLDTKAEQAYDDLVALASFICDTPISLVSLIDEDRQWFKARVGLDVSETPREQAFCSHAILEQDEVMVVRDASVDERFHDNPLVTGDPDIRFYAGAPLLTGDGHALGTLCVIDKEARDLTPEQEQALRALARQASLHLEMRRAMNEVRDLLDESDRRADKGSALPPDFRERMAQVHERMESLRKRMADASN